MYSIFDISQYFLTHVDNVTPKKLQKLCYYAEAWSQALYDKGLINNSNFEAWVHGPVSPELYKEYKQFGWNEIPKPEGQTFTFNKETEELLDSVIETYGDLSGNELEALTHSEEPWLEARKGYEDHESCTIQLNNETMSKYYKSIYIGD